MVGTVRRPRETCAPPHPPCIAVLLPLPRRVPLHTPLEPTCTPCPAGCSGRVRRGSTYPWPSWRLHHRGPGDDLPPWACSTPLPFSGGPAGGMEAP